VFKKGSLVFTKLIPVGGNHITNDISMVCKISTLESEKIKKQYGMASLNMLKNNDIIKINNLAGKGERELYLEDIIQVMDARISEILYLVRKQLESNGLLNNLAAGIVITGGGLFNIKGILDVAQSCFEVPVRLGYPNYIGVANPIYSAAAGMAIYALKQKKSSSLGNKVGQINEAHGVDDENDDEDDDDRGKFSFKTNWIEKIKEFFADFF
jgi:cell division protein FtsA